MAYLHERGAKGYVVLNVLGERGRVGGRGQGPGWAPKEGGQLGQGVGVSRAAAASECHRPCQVGLELRDSIGQAGCLQASSSSWRIRTSRAWACLCCCLIACLPSPAGNHHPSAPPHPPTHPPPNLHTPTQCLMRSWGRCRSGCGRWRRRGWTPSSYRQGRREGGAGHLDAGPELPLPSPAAPFCSVVATSQHSVLANRPAMLHPGWPGGGTVLG